MCGPAREMQDHCGQPLDVCVRPLLAHPAGRKRSGRWRQGGQSSLLLRRAVEEQTLGIAAVRSFFASEIWIIQNFQSLMITNKKKMTYLQVL